MTSDREPRRGRGELVVIKKLSLCREDIVIKSLIGLGIGLVPALILFRGRFIRGLLTGLGAGVGLGWGYGDCDTGLRSHGKYDSDRVRVISRPSYSSKDDEDEDRDGDGNNREEKDRRIKGDK